MLAFGKHMVGKVHPSGLAGLGEEVTVFYRHGPVPGGLPEEAGGRVGAHMVFQAHVGQGLGGGIRAQQVFKGAPVGVFPGGNHRVAEDGPIGPVGENGVGRVRVRYVRPVDAQAGAEVPPGGEAADGQPVRVDVKPRGVFPHKAHRPGQVPQRLHPQRGAAQGVHRVG
jgi:hypothetical protein